MCKINKPSVNTAMSNLCYIINRLADNSNICKSLSVAVAGAFVSFTHNPSYGQFWFIFILICILAFNDGLYMGLKENLQLISDKLSNAAVYNPVSITNPFDLKKLRKLDLNIVTNEVQDPNNIANNQNVDAQFEPNPKKGWKKFKRDVRTAKNGFCTITTWPFYTIILVGMLVFKFGDIVRDFFGHI